ncbi:methyltransferase domain-containing protein [Ascidiaceihabitans sp.]|uniref:class I SAM-dependent methyltransferase n=1 Tax=Ascidiaceihabitans sp. TaxID=1872644 RepID=UPI0032971396
MSSDEKQPEVVTDTAASEAEDRPRPTVKDRNQEKYLKYRHSGEISKEFGRQIARGEDPRCTYPWNRLDIVLRDNRTKVCSDFPIRLPRFDWPTTEDFHKEDQMWNHPFMQRMRGGMGTTDAVPFCDICVRSNKRAVNNYDWRRKAQTETRKLYHSIEGKLREDVFRGDLNEIGEGLSEMRFLKPNGRTVRLFKDKTMFYRRRVSKHRFFQIGRVLQIGLRNALVSPFLAEANPHFEAADFSRVKGDFMTSVVSRFGIDAKATQLDPLKPLPFADDSFDGVWLDGQTLFRMDRDALFHELKRVLAADGVVHVQEAYGAGMLLRMILDDPNANNGRFEVEEILAQSGHTDLAAGPRPEGAIGAAHAGLFSGEMDDDLMGLRAALDASVARTTVLNGIKHQGVGGLFTEKELRRVLRKHDLTLDTVMPPQFTQFKPLPAHEDAMARLSGDNALMAALGAVATDPNQPLTDIGNYDGTVIFNAFVNVTSRKGTTN